MPAMVNAHQGWRWYRVRVRVPQLDPMSLLAGPFGNAFAYEIFANGQRFASFGRFDTPGLRLPAVAVFPFPAVGGEVLLAFRVRSVEVSTVIPEEPSRSSCRLGTVRAIATDAELWRDRRKLAHLPALLIGAVGIAGALFFVILPLFRGHAMEYLWFGLYLAVGITELVLPIAPEILGLNSAGVALTAVALLSLSAYYSFAFLVREVFASRNTLAGWIAVTLAYAVVAGLIVAVLTGIGLSLKVLEAGVVISISFRLLGFYEFAWRRSSVRGRMGALHAILFAQVFLTFAQFLASALGFEKAVGPQGYLLRIWGLMGLAFAMAILLNLRSVRLADDRVRLGREMAAAAEVQTLLLTQPCESGIFIVDPVYLPASEVGGDFYQIRNAADGSLVVIAGDVSGKGLKAAMLVSVTVGAFRLIETSSPAQVLAELNRALAGHTGGGFVTCLCARFEANGAVTIANAGHPSPYCDGREVELEAGLPLGIAPGVQYGEFVTQGEQFTLVSDGVVEAENARRELFGFERTRDISGKSAAEIAEAAKAWGQNDDITVVTIQRIDSGKARRNA